MKDKVREIKDQTLRWMDIAYKQNGDSTVEMGHLMAMLTNYISQLEDRVEVLERDKNKEDMYKSMGL